MFATLLYGKLLFMQLSKQHTKNVASFFNSEAVFQLPEKVLQFGTGVLLRGLCDFFIDKANKQNVFNGRVVVVKSTDSGGADTFEQQDCLYTHFIRGIEDGKIIDETIINASISRVLSAGSQWQAILACAANPEMQIIVSNTTEVGITFTEDDINAVPPSSFPGKLLAFLHARYNAFNGSEESGMIIIPTELIVNNGDRLKQIIIALARYNNLSEQFVEWLERYNNFCSSLVDRIVPGKPPAAEKEEAEKQLGYTDDLMLMSEVYSLWAIESAKEKVLNALSFSIVDKGVVLAHDITKFRELKLRLLNGPHTFSCGLAVLCGFETVKQAMQDEVFSRYMHDLLMHEIAPALTNDDISLGEAKLYAGEVLDRFRNPFLQHKWLSITLQYSSKMLMRNVPNLLNHYARHNAPPKLMAVGFAAYLRFMQSEQNGGGGFMGNANGKTFVIDDDKAALLHSHFERKQKRALVYEVLADEALWGRDLTALFGFPDMVADYLEGISQAPDVKAWLAGVL